jgi:hypothetical protein
MEPVEALFRQHAYVFIYLLLALGNRVNQNCVCVVGRNININMMLGATPVANQCVIMHLFISSLSSSHSANSTWQ